ncbi:zinc finger FYVE domain-containing protein 16 isoform X2 [Ambystoma mexicanum]|uniref:zinc finger FYVE domain-containing protein 16 isoform X2 n=1 Tax=Ambystoma mexicanum TaxID=8296 RepID=UPI0037E8D46E
MDTYFKAAVCDLDKLLDDFEQSTDELESCRAVVTSTNANCLSFSSELLCQPEIHAPKLQHGITSNTTLDAPFESGRKDSSKARSEKLKTSQNEKNVTGLDLLSSLDGGMSDEIQPSNLGRGGVLVCDLISDTGRLIHSTTGPDFAQELQPNDLLLSKDSLPNSDLPFQTSEVCVASPTNDGHSNSWEPKVGGIMSQGVPHVGVEEMGLPDLKTDCQTISMPCEPCLGGSDVILKEEQPKKNILLIPGNLSTSTSSIDIGAMLLCETVEASIQPEEGKCTESTDSQCLSNENVGLEAVALEKQMLSDAFKIRVEESDCFLSQEEGGPGKVKDQLLEEQLCVSVLRHNPALQAKDFSEPVSSPEEVHSSLSCLPIAVSLCGSFVATEEVSPIVPNEGERCLVHDAESLHAEMVNTVASDFVSCCTTKPGSREEELEEKKEINKTLKHKEEDIQTNQNSISKSIDMGALPHFEVVHFSANPEMEEKSVNNAVCQFNEAEYKEVASTSTDSFHLNLQSGQDDMLACDVLISDAELDAFLNEQTTPVYRANSFDGAFTELDASLSQLLFIDGSTTMEQDVEGANEVVMGEAVCSSDGALDTNDMKCELDRLKLVDPSSTEEGTAHIIHDALKPTLRNTELQISGENNLKVHGGARPKHLNALCPQMISDGQASKSSPSSPVAPVTESHRGVSLTVSAGTEISSDSANLNRSGIETRVEAKECVSTEHTLGGVDVSSLGQKQPSWVPDSEAPNCMKCQVKFTFTKRRHHCRACGKVFCATCCNRKCKLHYMEKEARVCVVCHDSISKGTKEQKRVWFADGVLPNGELADTTKLSAGGKRSSQDHSPVSPILPESLMVTSPAIGTCVASDEPANEETSSLTSETEKLHSPAAAGAFTVAGLSDYRMLCGVEKCVGKDMSLLPEDEAGLPPLLLATGDKGGDAMMEERPCHKQLLSLLEEGGPNPLTFILNANLLVNVKLITYSSEKCWFFATNGLHGLGQAELIILLLRLPNEDTLPKDIFKLFLSIYKDALKGKHINNLENVTFNESFLDSKDHGGFLFITPTFQNVDELPLPNNPFLCGILLHKMEVPWAKVFPIRVMLRLGAEYGVYPSPIVSMRNRKPLYGEIGHTIMNLLADLRNYQYTLPNIDGLFIHMEMGTSCIKLPLKRHNEILKVIHSSNEHVISIGACFSTEADSHLVCVQNDDGVYQTQANSSTGQPRKVTGASFVIFNGALKTASGFLAKSSIVEDGLMVQITPETMEGLRQALREKKDFRIACGKVDAGELREDVNICWVDSEDKANKGVVSPIDGQSLEGILSDKITQESDFESNDKLVKCTEVFYLLRNHDLSMKASYFQFAKEIATACTAALCDNLRSLKEHGMNKISLRISMDIDMVEYQAGSWGRLLPQHYLNDLDGALIPVIHGRTSDSSTLPLVMELIFFLLENLF